MSALNINYGVLWRRMILIKHLRNCTIILEMMAKIPCMLDFGFCMAVEGGGDQLFSHHFPKIWIYTYTRELQKINGKMELKEEFHLVSKNFWNPCLLVLLCAFAVIFWSHPVHSLNLHIGIVLFCKVPCESRPLWLSCLLFLANYLSRVYSMKL